MLKTIHYSIFHYSVLLIFVINKLCKFNIKKINENQYEWKTPKAFLVNAFLNVKIFQQPKKKKLELKNRKPFF